MNTLIYRFFLFFILALPLGAQAQNSVDDLSYGYIQPGVVYTIQPDYRRCASPYCGGWWLTPVNRVFVTVPTEDDLGNSIVAPEPIYVATIDYSRLGFGYDEIRKFESLIYAGQALIKGALIPFNGVQPEENFAKLQSLLATGTWGAANDNLAQGSFLDVKSSGIFCITTPCPYYEANQINTSWSFQFHELNFDKAGLSDSQEQLARELVAERSLVMTGVRFESKGMTGSGIGIAATRVYFPFPK